MKYFQWTIGSTTVRNPDRLRDGLKILDQNFKGKKWDVSEQEKFFELLRKNKVYEMEDENYDKMISKRKQEHARKWISILNQLGLCFAYHSSDKPVIITEAGQALLDNPDIEDEIFLRQLLKYQKPCVLPKQNGASFENVSVLPFVASLKITYELGGLSKDEISIFLNTTVRMDDIDKAIKQVNDYRNQKDKITGRVKKREFYYQTQLARLEEVFKDEVNERMVLIKNLVAKFKKDKSFVSSNEGVKLLADITKGGKGSNTIKAKRAQRDIKEALKSGKGAVVIKKIFLAYYLPLKISTLKDYADLTARYLRKSGLFSVSRDKLITVSEKEDLIKTLLSQKWELVSDDRYLDYLWNSFSPALPSDKKDYLKKHLNTIKAKEKALFDKVGVRESLKLVGKDISPAENLLQLKQQTKAVEGSLLKLKEVEFYYSQREEKQVDDIINFYDLILTRQILGGEAYYPAYMEWNTWRVFLAIDTLANKPYEARNFKLDDELQPINHAAGNQADMVFEYENFILVTEVTLLTRANQWSAEIEPVPRHVAKVQSQKKEKDVFGLFVAPQIDINTVLTFFNNRKYAVNDEIIDLTIIPFSIDQIKSLLSVFKQKRFSTQDMKRLFVSIREEMSSSKDALEWNKKIPVIMNDWSQKL
ncbi:MAG: AlwI family type II restriction endonuclease [Candidatus Zambryskibacteria bacterium]|nr:AlwI family type II restriction endonuclease [Candidatus Zambryskibacteria bacterium]